MEDGTSVILRRHGNPEGTRLVLSHANGLCADAYYPFWSLLADRFDLILYDFRNHGWNPPGDPVGDPASGLEAHNIETFIRDMEQVEQAIDRHFGERPKIGVFHSMSAQVAVLQAARSGGFSALVLFDPFICPPGCAPQHLETLEATMRQLAEGARRRRETFASEEAFAERIRSAPAFERLVPGAADLIARTTLRQIPGDTEYGLRCPREYEARIYQQGLRWARAVNVDKLALSDQGHRRRSPGSALLHADGRSERTHDPRLRLRARDDASPAARGPWGLRPLHAGIPGAVGSRSRARDHAKCVVTDPRVDYLRPSRSSSPSFTPPSTRRQPTSSGRGEGVPNDGGSGSNAPARDSRSGPGDPLELKSSPPSSTRFSAQVSPRRIDSGAGRSFR